MPIWFVNPVPSQSASRRKSRQIALSFSGTATRRLRRSSVRNASRLVEIKLNPGTPSKKKRKAKKRTITARKTAIKRSSHMAKKKRKKVGSRRRRSVAVRRSGLKRHVRRVARQRRRVPKRGKFKIRVRRKGKMRTRTVRYLRPKRRRVSRRVRRRYPHVTRFKVRGRRRTFRHNPTRKRRRRLIKNPAKGRRRTRRYRRNPPADGISMAAYYGGWDPDKTFKGQKSEHIKRSDLRGGDKAPSHQKGEPKPAGGAPPGYHWYRRADGTLGLRKNVSKRANGRSAMPKRRKKRKTYRRASAGRRAAVRRHVKRYARRGRLPRRGRMKIRGKRVSYVRGKRGRGRARKRYMSRVRFKGRTYRIYHNPKRNGMVGTAISVLKAAAPIGIAFVGGRLLTGLIASKLGGAAPAGAPAAAPAAVAGMVPDVLAPHLGPLVSVGLIVIAGFAAKKVSIVARYQTPIYIGLGLNALSVLWGQYAPASVKGFLNVGDVYDEALADYVDTAGDLGDYVETGASEELADVEEALADYEEGNFNTAAGALNGVLSPRMLTAPVRRGSFARQVPHRNTTRQVTAAGRVPNDSMYRGIFKSTQNW